MVLLETSPVYERHVAIPAETVLVCDLYILAGDAGRSAPSRVRLSRLRPCWKLNYLVFHSNMVGIFTKKKKNNNTFEIAKDNVDD